MSGVLHVYVEIAATVIYFKAMLKEKIKQTAGNVDCYHGFIQPETTLQQVLLDLRLFIQAECFVAVSSCKLQTAQIRSYFQHSSNV